MPTNTVIHFRGAMRPGSGTQPLPRRRSGDNDANATVRRVAGGAYAIQAPRIAPTDAEHDQAVLERREEAAAAMHGMWQPERESPWLIVVYLVGFITGFAVSVAWPWGLL